MNALESVAPGPAVRLLAWHRWLAWFTTPFLLVSVVLAVGLSHSRWLERLSERLWDSLPIPEVRLDSPIQPGSWEQARELARLATGRVGHVITTGTQEHIAVVQAFEAHSHDPAVAQSNRHVKVHVDTQAMRIVRIDDRDHSLTSMAHGVHAWRLAGVDHLSVTTFSTLGLLALTLSGAWAARRSWQTSGPRRRHAMLGLLLIPLTLLVAVTSLMLEFGGMPRPEQLRSHPLPAVAWDETPRPGSLDQARRLAERTAGAPMRSVFIRSTSDWKFSQEGDGIGGLSVWVDAQTMQVRRLTDWRNDSQALVFVLHDGRWLGGLNALNIHDVYALALLGLMIGGLALRRGATS